jgi:glycosyltransferase involved in cell wall biosynthesis
MPVYNDAPFIRAAIDSILGQTFTDWELIVVDDGSTDATPAIVHEAASRDGRISTITQRRSGIPRSRNRGVALARGELVAVHDADDLSVPERLARQVDFLDRHPEVAMVGSFAEWIEATGRVVVMGFPVSDEEIRANLTSRSCFQHGSIMLRRSALQTIGGYRPEFPLAEDVDLYFRLAERFRLANIPEVLYRHRRSESSISQQRMSLLQKYVQVAIELARQRREEGRDILG